MLLFIVSIYQLIPFAMISCTNAILGKTIHTNKPYKRMLLKGTNRKLPIIDKLELV
jgi:hypothetical protein